MGGEWLALKLASGAVDRRIRGLPHKENDGATRRFLSLVHGDAKSANLVFTARKADDLSCAAYDFQYVGVGLGCSDVVRQPLRFIHASLGFRV
jgi:hypothetical protein